MIRVSAAVEGLVDEAVFQRLVDHVGAEPGTIYGKSGKARILEKLSGWNNAARTSPWFVLVDLDQDYSCAPTARALWMPNPAPNLCFRIAVRAIESWLMADATSLAKFLRINSSRVSSNPEGLSNPKTEMVNLARVSTSAAVRDDMVPRTGSGRSTGPAYTSRLIEFANTRWRPAVAANRAQSLNGALNCLRRFVK